MHFDLCLHIPEFSILSNLFFYVSRAILSLDLVKDFNLMLLGGFLRILRFFSLAFARSQPLYLKHQI